jgi:hypothetical protein
MSSWWGEWYEGEAVDVRIEHTGVDNYPNDFLCKVQVRNRATGEVTDYTGRGSFVGNFSPIWIPWKGKKTQLEELLRQTTV